MVIQTARDGPRTLVSEGDLDVARRWASVTKAAVAFGAAAMVAAREVEYGLTAGPEGATLAHLLAHASGLGLEASDRTMAVGSRRIYSNVGIDLAVEALAHGQPHGTWMRDWVFAPLEMTDTKLLGRAAFGVVGPLTDVAALGTALASSGAIETSRAQMVAPFLPELAGVVPGFGRFDPCWWGLGVEVHGAKRHWMGSVATSSAYGHFGQSSTLLLVDPDASLVVAAASEEPFGAWARDLWPRWMDEVMTWGIGQ